MLRQALFACISPSRVLDQETETQQDGVGRLERYQVPYTLAVSSVDKLTLELDFSAVDSAGGDCHDIVWKDCIATHSGPVFTSGWGQVWGHGANGNTARFDLIHSSGSM